MLPSAAIILLSLTSLNSCDSLGGRKSPCTLHESSEPSISAPETNEKQGLGGPRSAYMAIDSDGMFESECQEIASKLSVPLSSKIIDSPDERYTHELSLVPYEFQEVSTFALAIESITVGSEDSSKNAKRRKRPSKKPKSNPHFIDFCPPKNSRAGKRSGQESGTDLLVKATIPKKSIGSTVVWDLTAGFGQDSLILALNGASKVHMIERDPFVFALLEDGLRRLRQLSKVGLEFAQDLEQRLTLGAGDGVDALQQVLLEGDKAIRPDICYLDPMFPPRTKSASVKKPMQILHGLLNTQEEAKESIEERLEEERKLLEYALEAAKCRVVVKRPAKAPLLGGESGDGRKPSYAVEGSVNRWDVYILSNNNE
ncbi:unnamed protein product [Cylindrotheca closterium]|uniref:Uncharacterized protein n=1 Tax=Cylindrotheca closterium TaxID=2856 RepID=A0AAD2CQ38_9STRA|nr:unnamed protein product [Cylindrotheca closterium]